MDLTLMELCKRKGLGKTSTKLLVESMYQENEFRKAFMEMGVDTEGG